MITRVALVTTDNGRFQAPDVPSDARSWRIIERHGDGTVTVEIEESTEDRVARLEAQVEELKALLKRGA